MSETIETPNKPKAQKGWLTNTALAVFAALALADLTGCAAMSNSFNTLGNAAGSQVTKAGMFVLGKDADCRFDSVNRSDYSFNNSARNNASTATVNGCREIPSTAAQIKLAEQQEAVANVHFREQQKRMEEARIASDKMTRKMNDDAMARLALQTCQKREIQLLGEGKKMDESEGCAPILKQARELAQNNAPQKTTSFFGLFSN